ncbi:UV DNA damage repair endonuclease UvsE [Anaerobacillus sp. MEB173]|uniref:UV DNA damage repair endonuclease UvsE n=1 Tax=Anaerobacillus sp. MEB173 TaxID=3383345 RepID=UPI003F8F4027
MNVRFGYVAMSAELKQASPSQTMTVKQFEQLSDKGAAIRRLERIAISNLDNCLRLLKHNLAHEITFFRFSSRIVPLANHPLTENWRYEKAIDPKLKEVGHFINENRMRIDFHPDHFVVLNNQDETLLKQSLKTLLYHYKLLVGMGIDPKHRCVLHVGGKKQGKFQGLETFIDNFEKIPTTIQKMLMLENDDMSYDIEDVLYLGEKLGIPVVFDLHHYDVLPSETAIEDLWSRILGTWKHSPLPIKMHMSSPREGPNTNDKSHHDYIDSERLLRFLNRVKHDTDQLDIMIEAKKKDVALFKLMRDLSKQKCCRLTGKASIEIL